MALFRQDFLQFFLPRITLARGAVSRSEHLRDIAAFGASCAPKFFEAFSTALQALATPDAAPPYTLIVRAGSAATDFARAVDVYSNANRHADITSAPSTSFAAHAGPPTMLLGQAQLLSDLAWPAAAITRLLAAIQTTCAPVALLEECERLPWVKIVSPLLDKRVYPGAIVAFMATIVPTPSSDDSDDSAAPAALPEPAVVAPHDAQNTSIGAVQQPFSLQGRPFSRHPRVCACHCRALHPGARPLQNVRSHCRTHARGVSWRSSSPHRRRGRARRVESQPACPRGYSRNNPCHSSWVPIRRPAAHPPQCAP